MTGAGGVAGVLAVIALASAAALVWSCDASAQASGTVMTYSIVIFTTTVRLRMPQAALC